MERKREHARICWEIMKERCMEVHKKEKNNVYIRVERRQVSKFGRIMNQGVSEKKKNCFRS